MNLFVLLLSLTLTYGTEVEILWGACERGCGAAEGEVKPFAVVAQHGADEHRPVAIGITADRTALDHSRAKGTAILFGGNLPEKAQRVATPFSSATFTYNPQGSADSPPVFDAEHFSANFFSFFGLNEVLGQLNQECSSIRAPVPDVFPAGYSTSPVHRVNEGASIIADHLTTDSDFGTTLIYGNLGTHIHRLEVLFPSSSIGAFQDKGRCYPIPQPARAPWSGWFPRVYCYEEYQHNGLAITLQDFYFYKRFQVVKGFDDAASDATDDSVSSTSSSSSIDTSDSEIFSFRKSSSYSSSDELSGSVESTSTKSTGHRFNPPFGVPTDCAQLG
uniref:Uncharacterized protein n=1 Tax=Sexangularia sp. CB-2014 TaxID=1486929 RepID=A0A7S1VFB6_9EUKA|mmetsp:Transcript_2630/g.8413  ORF Transcript_2630/g.8413 Transcript_2630/m.8413 type:complete len:332 (+) Transcript_2630:84-1079(+)|eukprot:CAMPEP_0170752454 /NCGR_PEP_ID=MMETSP0437-20130122/11976_1 /TAXON_ID=0 /ORGANISM="Sexangularia sp." /LENGTH=331 /DNA_ID=CAMNT_0011091523 /DNA_START=90 /DNA_END=1085 /DNA_ORIENTATION=+